MAPGGGTVGLLEALLYELSEIEAALGRMRRQLDSLDPRGMLEGLLAENHANAVGHTTTARSLARDLRDATRLAAGGQELHEAVADRQRLRVLRRPPSGRSADDQAG